VTALAEVIGRLVGEPVRELRSLGIAIFLMTTASRRQIIAKRGAGPGASSAETAGLRWLGEHGDVPIPTVRGNDDSWVAMDYIAAGQPNRTAAM
jgi:hypothetical protein